MIVEAQLKPRPFFAACELLNRLGGNLPEHERSQLDTDHCQVGQTLGDVWHLSPVLTDAISRHHDETPTKPEDLAAIIQISAFIISRMGYPALPGKRTVLPPPLAAEVKANLNEYNVLARTLPDELNAAVRLYDLSA